jgi:hypothetical protein
MYRADRSALGAIGSPFVMVFPMNEILHFSQQLSRSRFTGSRWQRIDPFPQSADPNLSRFLNQFHLLLKPGTFPKQIYTGSPNPSYAPNPLLTDPIAKPESKPQNVSVFYRLPPRGIPEVVSLGEETPRSETRRCKEHKI